MNNSDFTHAKEGDKVIHPAYGNGEIIHIHDEHTTYRIYATFSVSGDTCVAFTSNGFQRLINKWPLLFHADGFSIQEYWDMVQAKQCPYELDQVCVVKRRPDSTPLFRHFAYVSDDHYTFWASGASSLTTKSTFSFAIHRAATPEEIKQKKILGECV